mgnify:CR=1 FL=1
MEELLVTSLNSSIEKQEFLKTSRLDEFFDHAGIGRSLNHKGKVHTTSLKAIINTKIGWFIPAYLFSWVVGDSRFVPSGDKRDNPTKEVG